MVRDANRYASGRIRTIRTLLADAESDLQANRAERDRLLERMAELGDEQSQLRTAILGYKQTLDALGVSKEDD